MRTINALNLDCGGSMEFPGQVPWTERYHSSKLNKYIRNHRRNIGRGQSTTSMRVPTSRCQ
eukprot:4553116-Karenia_brevis.AAC.1